jgi:nucleolar MIF4G domain-containing protein 1
VYPYYFVFIFADYLRFQAKTGKYVPPHARGSFQDQDTKKQEQLKRLRRQMKGLLNRVAENNMSSIALEVRH